MKTHTMKICLVLILSCGSVLGADTDIRITTTTVSASPLTIKTDVFTRNGETNLVCLTTAKDGAVLNRIQSFYHDGLLIGESCSDGSNLQIFATEAGSPYSALFVYRSPNESQNGSVSFNAKDGSVVDAFTCTNGVYFPVESQKIRELSDEIMKARQQARVTIK